MIRFTAESKFRLCESATLRKLASMRRHGEMTDLTLICDESLYPIHRLVLAASSNHLSDEFYSETNGKVEKPPSSIMIPDASPIDMENLIKYMYSGQVVITENELDGLMRVAHTLKIDSLKEEFGVRVPGYLAKLKSSGKSGGKKLTRKNNKKCRNVTSVPDGAGAGSSRESRRTECQDENQFPDQTDSLISIHFEPIMSSTLLGDANNSTRPLPRRVEELKKSGGPGLPAKENKNGNGNGQPSKSRRTRPRISPMALTSTGNVSAHLSESYLERKLKGRKMHNASVRMYTTKVVAKKTGLKRHRIGEVNPSVRKAGKRTPANERTITTTTTPKAPKVHKQTGTSTAGGSDSEFGPRYSNGKSRPLTPYPKYFERPLKRLQGSEKAIPIEPKMKSRVSSEAVKMALTSTQKKCTLVQVIPKVVDINSAVGPGKSAESGVSPMKSCPKSEREDKKSTEEGIEPTQSVVGVNVALVGKKGWHPKKLNTEVDSGAGKRRNYNTRASKRAELKLATEEAEGEELVYRGKIDSGK